MKFIARFTFFAAIAAAIPALGAMQVDINSADAKTLAQALDGVGLVKAEEIVAYREAHGPFRSLDDLARVKGIGPRLIEENRETIVFGAPPAASSPQRALQPPVTW
jgi:competence protein ComEA